MTLTRLFIAQAMPMLLIFYAPFLIHAATWFYLTRSILRAKYQSAINGMDYRSTWKPLKPVIGVSSGMRLQE